MRFLFLTQYFPPEVGAPQVRLAAVIQELLRLGHEVEVVTTLPNYPLGKIFPAYQGHFYHYEEWQGVPIHRVWCYAAMGTGIKRMINYGSFTVTALYGLWQAQRPDYLFVESPPPLLSIPAWLFSLGWRKPIILNIADLWPDSIKELGLLKSGFILKFAELLEHWSYRQATYINAVTEGIRHTLIQDKGVAASQVLFLPNGVDIELFKPSAPDTQLLQELGIADKKVILYAGTLGFAQGLEVALQAMKMLQSQLPDLLLILIGGGSERHKLTEIARQEHLLNVKFLDPQPPEYIARLYTIAYAGFASLKKRPLFEGARPSKLFPIMASGKPVIYSGAGEAAKLVKEEANAGIIVPPEDPQALAQAIRELSDNPRLANQFGENGRRYVEQHLSWSQLVKSWLQQLQNHPLC